MKPNFIIKPCENVGTSSQKQEPIDKNGYQICKLRSKNE